MGKLLILMLCVLQLRAQHSVQDCKRRFDRYLNFHGSLSASVKFSDSGIVIQPAGTLQRIVISAREIPALAAFMASSSVKEQVSFFSSKKQLSVRTCDSLLLEGGNDPERSRDALPLSGIRIAIDPGHFGTTLAEAAVEQKFLRFVPDPVNRPNDTVMLFESALTFNTATMLKKMLEREGATVMLTREKANYTSFGCTFQQWVKNRNRTLDSLVTAGVISQSKALTLRQAKEYDLFWNFFRDYDLSNRAALINDFRPHATAIIHFNVDEKNQPWKSHTRKNFSMAFIGGGFTAQDLSRPDGRMHFLRLLLTDQLDRSERLAALTVSNFNKNLHIRIASQDDATYLRKNSLATGSRGVFCRNLALCRKVNSPLVYGESLYQDNESESFELMRQDKDLYGVRTNTRLHLVAQSYYEAILTFFSKEY